MKNKNLFEIKFISQNITPYLIQAKNLGEIIITLDEFLKSIVNNRTNINKIFGISLVNINEGCAALEFSSVSGKTN